MNSNKAFVIFSGNNQRAVIAFCRFAKRQHIPFYIISSGASDPIYQTVYSKNVVFKRLSRALEYHNIRNILVNVIEEYHLEGLIVLPSTEYLNRFLLDNKEGFSANKVQVPLVDAPLYRQISDKKIFTKTCSDNGLSVPKESHTINNVKFPFVIKPKRYFNSKKKVQFKPIIVENTQALHKIEDKIAFEECFFQEYIGGRCFYLLFYISQNGKDVIFSQENLIQQADGGSMIGAISSDIHTQQIAKDYLNLFREINFHGIIMVELKFSNQEYYMIEANPRLWGPSQLFIDAKVPIFHNFAEDLGFTAKNEYKKKGNTKYFWYGGLIKNYQNNRECAYYNYSNGKLLRELPSWIKHDFYRRKDTSDIFINESFKNN